MFYSSDFSLFRSLTFVFVLSFYQMLSAQDVSIRAGFNVSVMGEINGPFVGPVLGLEVSTSTPIAFDFDFSVGAGKNGRLSILQPAVKYYFGSERDSGFFLGAMAKIMTLVESEDQDLLADHLYALGPMLGIKQKVGENFNIALISTPHVTMGGINEADVAGIGVCLGFSYTF